MKVFVQNLKKIYKQEILKEVNFNLESGKVYCLLGRNGAGKTTLMKILAGMLNYDSGSIKFNQKQNKDEIFHYVSENPVFLDFLSGVDNLDFVQKLHNMNMTKIELEMYIQNAGMQSFAKELVVNYSHGMKHQLALAIAFLIKPKVLLLDEPLVSLDPINIDVMRKKLEDYAINGNIVFISTHMLPIANKIGDEILLLRDGVIHQVVNNFAESDFEEFILNKI
ncbi:ABC transporter ATP-binding protein [Bacillus gaemokensis]|uniref:ABC transporter domain-containing protein n=1 Tax=Bacillus gaemokensis TaxID=574375 RepID=A0A073JZ72_9BACI|nr:ABC transporter ATP-binding protein [Bacillus gaemokensis]KEK20354.1 hypothetical protein BAGA_29700 [Bacillus gaemokensis]KYG37765.1 hypothetical protein AZF08_21775 [Bacillus gaemokensis]